MMADEWRSELERSGALREGHFLLSSGLHSPAYVQCALLLSDPARARRAGEAVAGLVRAQGTEVDSVLAPALGGVIIGHEVAAALGCAAGMACRDAVARLARAIPPPAGLALPEVGESRRAIPSTGHRAAWLLDSVSLVRASDAHAIVVTGSHGALLGGRPDHVLETDVHAAIFNDAGGGKDGAGHSRLGALDARGIAAATVDCESARIGEGRSTYETGVLSRVNEAARRLELNEGMSCREAVARMLGLG